MFRILVVRLGSMGDVIHALPAVASLKHSFPHSRVSWILKPQWTPLLAGNPFVDEIIPYQRTSAGLAEAWRRLRADRFQLAVDLQGLIQSALIASAARAEKIVGLDRSQAREPLASLFYSTAVKTQATHRVDQYLEVVAGAGATNLVRKFPLPDGKPEGSLPARFVLACPLAGWGSKQWPIECYSQLARRLRDELQIPLVVNGPPHGLNVLRSIDGAIPHVSGVDGLIDATRRADAIVGVDSGPMHLAAGLQKPGVAIFGPTDPASHGPYWEGIRALRAPDAATTYKRGLEIDPAMLRISAEQVFEPLAELLSGHQRARRERAS